MTTFDLGIAPLEADVGIKHDKTDYSENLEVNIELNFCEHLFSNKIRP